jgi:hypothetical protein
VASSKTRAGFIFLLKSKSKLLRSRHVERARYEADLTRRRSLRVDPDNRLVPTSSKRNGTEGLRGDGASRGQALLGRGVAPIRRLALSDSSHTVIRRTGCRSTQRGTVGLCHCCSGRSSRGLRGLRESAS